VSPVSPAYPQVPTSAAHEKTHQDKRSTVHDLKQKAARRRRLMIFDQAAIGFGVGFPTIGHEANAREVEMQDRPFSQVETWITEGF
jgi:hypothetical protein